MSSFIFLAVCWDTTKQATWFVFAVVFVARMLRARCVISRCWKYYFKKLLCIIKLKLKSRFTYKQSLANCIQKHTPPEFLWLVLRFLHVCGSTIQNHNVAWKNIMQHRTRTTNIEKVDCKNSSTLLETLWQPIIYKLIINLCRYSS